MQIKNRRFRNIAAGIAALCVIGSFIFCIRFGAGGARWLARAPGVFVAAVYDMIAPSGTRSIAADEVETIDLPLESASSGPETAVSAADIPSETGDEGNALAGTASTPAKSAEKKTKIAKAIPLRSKDEESSASVTVRSSSSIPVAANATSAASSAAPTCGSLCEVALVIEGMGRGIVTSTPPGMMCDATCAWHFSKGMIVTLRATPDTASSFGGWTGACSGKKSECTIAANAPVSVSVIFSPKWNGGVAVVGAATGTAIAASSPAVTVARASSSSPSQANAASDIGASVTTTASTTASGNGGAVSTSSRSGAPPDHLVIASVQIAGASSANDFVKIDNPTAENVDVSGWRLRKRSATGVEYSLRQFPKGTAIGPKAQFIWANSADGYAQSIGADASSSETLSANNSVALLDASGTVIDAVAWGTGVGQFGEGEPFPTNPGSGEMLVRKTADGTMVDTRNNADDFMIVGQ